MNKHIYPTTNLEDKYLQRFLPHKERLKKPKLSKRENINYTIGLIIFIVFFIFFIPYLLYKFNSFTFLLVYFLNLDLTATMLGSIEGPLHKYFKYLYSDSTPLIGYISQTLIALIVLGAVFLIVVGRNKNKSIGIGLVRYLFTILITFLAPNRFISEIMHNSFIFLNNFKNISITYKPYFALIPGVLITYLFILTETFALEKFSKPLGNIFDKYINKLKFMKNLEKYRK